MYFDNFPRVFYDFPINEDGSNKLVVVSDITRNVRFKKEFIERLNVYELYRMRDGETIEQVSEKLYGSPNYHWILMILNERYDYIEDFSLTTPALDAMIQRKYGNRKDDVKMYADFDGLVTNGKFAVKMENTENNVGDFLLDKIKVGQVIKRKTSIGDYLAVVDSFSGDYINVSMQNGELKLGDEVSVYKYYDNEQGVFTEELVGETKILECNLGTGLSKISNYEYETIVNETKRIIKVLPSSYLSQIVNEFEALIGS